MEIIIIPLLLVLLVLLIHINNVNSQAFRNLRAKLDGLLRETNQLKEEIKKFSKPAGVPEAIKKEDPKAEPKKVMIQLVFQNMTSLFSRIVFHCN
jgi:hypothetical protein